MAIMVYLGLLERTTEGPQEREAIPQWPRERRLPLTLPIPQSLAMLCTLSEPELAHGALCPVTCL